MMYTIRCSKYSTSDVYIVTISKTMVEETLVLVGAEISKAQNQVFTIGSEVVVREFVPSTTLCALAISKIQAKQCLNLFEFHDNCNTQSRDHRRDYCADTASCTQ